LVAVNLESKPDKLKIAMLFTFAGSKAQGFHRIFTYEEEGDPDKYENVVEQFDRYCMPCTNETCEKYVFHTRYQEQDRN